MDSSVKLTEEQVKQLLRDSEINKKIDKWHLDRVEAHSNKMGGSGRVEAYLRATRHVGCGKSLNWAELGS